MSEENSKMMQRDLEVIWHPCTQMKDHETLPLVPVKSGKGVYLYDFEGNNENFPPLFLNPLTSPSKDFNF